MPLLTCPACGLETYDAAQHASVDRRPRCGIRLKRLAHGLSELSEPYLHSLGWRERFEEALHPTR